MDKQCYCSTAQIKEIEMTNKHKERVKDSRVDDYASNPEYSPATRDLALDLRDCRAERDNAARFAQRISKAYLHVSDELDLMRENLRIANEANRLSKKRVRELEELETRAYDCGVYDYNTLLAKHNELWDEFESCCQRERATFEEVKELRQRVQELEEECDALTEAYQKLWRRWDALDNQVFELKEREDGWQPLMEYWRRQHDALREAVRELYGLYCEFENDPGAYGEYWDNLMQSLTEGGGGESVDGSLARCANALEPGLGTDISQESDRNRPAALDQLFVRDGVPYRFGVGPACMGVQFELTDSPADVPYNLAWDWLQRQRTQPIHCDGAPRQSDFDGLYECFRVGDCEKCRGSKKEDVIKYDPPSYRMGRAEKIKCLRCQGDGGRYKLKRKES